MNNNSEDEWKKIVYKTEYERWGLDKKSDNIGSDFSSYFRKKNQEIKNQSENLAIELRLGKTMIFEKVYHLMCLSDINRFEKFGFLLTDNQFNSAFGRVQMKTKVIEEMAESISNQIIDGKLIKGNFSFLESMKAAAYGRNLFIFKVRDGIREYDRFKKFKRKVYDVDKIVK